MRCFTCVFWGVFVMAMSVTSFVSACDATSDNLQSGPSGRVIAVPDGSTLILENDIIVRLIGLQAPKLSKGRDDVLSWPMAEDAKRELTATAMGKNVELRYGGTKRDRHERALAQVFIHDDDGRKIWVQAHMMGKGMARVYSFADNRQCLDELYALERRARVDRLGLWQHANYAILNANKPKQFAQKSGQYELAEGRVLNADRVGSRVYMNFGRFWKEDVTVVIERKALKLFEQADLDPLKLTGAFIRVRGWVDLNDGPRFDVTHPEQIEILATK